MFKRLNPMMLGAALLFVWVEDTHAWRIYNNTGWDLQARIDSIDGGATSCGAWDDPDGQEIKADKDEGPHFSNESCNPTKRRDSNAWVTIVLENSFSDLSEEKGRMMCRLKMLGGGFIVVEEFDKTGFDDEGDIRSHVNCISYFAEDKGYNSSDCSGDEDLDLNNDGFCQQLVIDTSHYGAEDVQSSHLIKPEYRDLRFLVGGDPQFWHNKISFDGIVFSDGYTNSGVNETAEVVLESMLDLRRSALDIRGIILAGDLLHTQRDSEQYVYEDLLGTDASHIFEGLGNHDVLDGSSNNGDSLPELNHGSAGRNVFYDYIGEKARNTTTTRRKSSSDRQFPHYSWDWHDVHFVQLNLFAGDDKPSGASDGANLDPRDALQFLKDDLDENVGNTGRPIILIQHYGVDLFGKDWWEESQREDLWNAIADYNVIAMFNGHSHQDDTDEPGERRTNWKPQTQRTHNDSNYLQRSIQVDGTNDLIPTFNAGAMRGPTDCDSKANACLNGAFLDIEINYCNELIVSTRDTNGDKYGGEQTVEFVTPEAEADICNHPDPVAVIGLAPLASALPLEVDQGQLFVLDGSDSTDVLPIHQANLEYRWILDNIRFPWSSSPTLDASFFIPTSINATKPDITLQVRDDYGFVGSKTEQMTVNNVAPVIIPSGFADGDVISHEALRQELTGWSLPWSLSYVFTDPGGGKLSYRADHDGPFTCTVDYGDGTVIVTKTSLPDVDGHGCNFGYTPTTVPGYLNHKYTTRGIFDVTISVEDKWGAISSIGFEVNNDPAPEILGSCTTFKSTVNKDWVCGVNIEDLNRDDVLTVEVDFGDGTVIPDYSLIPTGNNINYVAHLSHVYIDAGVYGVSITVTDANGQSDTESFNVTVSEPPVLTPPTIVVLNGGVEELPDSENRFSTINGTEGVAVSRQFRIKDSANPGHTEWRLYVAWGDWFSEGSVVSNTSVTSTGDRTVNYTYSCNFSGCASEDHGSFVAYVLAQADLGNSQFGPLSLAYSFTVNIASANSPPELDGVTTTAAVINEGQTFQRLAQTFSDADSGDSWTVTVDWGDGSVPENPVLSGKSFDLSHQYRLSGIYSVLVTVDDGEEIDQVTIPLTVNNVNPILSITSFPNPSVLSGEEASITARWSDPGRTTDNDFEWTWSVDGEVQTSGTRGWIFGGANREVPFSTTIDIPGNYVLEFQISDSEGGSSAISRILEVKGEEVFESGFESE